MLYRMTRLVMDPTKLSNIPRQPSPKLDSGVRVMPAVQELLSPIVLYSMVILLSELLLFPSKKIAAAQLLQLSWSGTSGKVVNWLYKMFMFE